LESLTNKLVFDEVMATLLSEEMRWKDFESTKEALVVHGILKEKGKEEGEGNIQIPWEI
jgi:hypothetical protein